MLHIRGSKPTVQPIVGDDGDLWAFNGECYNLQTFTTSIEVGGDWIGCDGVVVGKNDEAPSSLSEECDTSILYSSIISTGLTSTLSKLQGEYAYAYVNNETVSFGRDELGRRSLTSNVDLEGLEGEGEFEIEQLVVTSTGGGYEVPPGIMWEGRGLG